ncbi:MAG TPA: DUF4197 domain-containing protein [Bacteroidia bacterium]|jgi:hypothetical protein|nr:DUF4197 domain-containing protein [Bacteroidia bacterium]
MNFKSVLTLALLSASTGVFAQFNLKNAENNASKDVNGILGKKNGSGALSNDDIVNGLKDALKVGSNNAGSSASKTDGFFKDSLIKIPFPPDAEKVRKTAVDLGMQKQVDDFVLSMNRAAEKAAVKSAPIFLNAITSMGIDDGMKILKGPDNAATQYMQGKTKQQLHDIFLPIVKAAIDSVQVTKYWKPIADTYNKDPFVTKVNPDLNEYVTQKALDGLFILLAAEELKIRKNPMARVDDILKKVFGSLDKH